MPFSSRIFGNPRSSHSGAVDETSQLSRSASTCWFSRVGTAASLPVVEFLRDIQGFFCYQPKAFYPRGFYALPPKAILDFSVSIWKKGGLCSHTLPKHWLFQEFSGNFDLKC